MQNEPIKSLEQRVAALEGLSLQITGLMGLVAQMAAGLAINAAAQANDAREIFKILLRILPGDAESRDAILDKLQRSEGESDQREAALSNIAQKLGEIAKLIPKNPPSENLPQPGAR
ncbi:MAG TPA: hypothetical protein VNV43_08865 [Candidatus Acidoferrales bacterium]|jgi:hypothetical protein|nr:hypothetical protein [Candidatus Acidoferrales bacterium]